jgi:hypothetical protein
MCPTHCHLLENIRGSRISDTTLQFHFKININQDMRIYVNTFTTLNIALTCVDCEDFSNNNFYVSTIFIIFSLVCISLHYSSTLVTPKEVCCITVLCTNCNIIVSLFLEQYCSTLCNIAVLCAILLYFVQYCSTLCHCKDKPVSFCVPFVYPTST